MNVNHPWHDIAQGNSGTKFQKVCNCRFCYIFFFPLLCCTTQNQNMQLFVKYYMYTLLFEMLKKIFSDDQSHCFLDWPWRSKVRLCPSNSGHACMYFRFFFFFQNVAGNISWEDKKTCWKKISELWKKHWVWEGLSFKPESLWKYA